MNKSDKSTVRNALIKLARSGIHYEIEGIADLCQLAEMSPEIYRGYVDDHTAAVKAMTRGGIMVD